MCFTTIIISVHVNISVYTCHIIPNIFCKSTQNYVVHGHIEVSVPSVHQGRQHDSPADPSGGVQVEHPGHAGPA